MWWFAWRGKDFLYLVRAPAPKSQHREAKYKARPRNVSCDWIPEQMKGIRTWEVTGRVWDYDLWYRCAVFLLKSFIPANFFKSWKENASDLRAGAPCKVISLSEFHDYFSFLLSSSHLLSFHSTLAFGSQGFYRSRLDFAQSPCGFNSASWKGINAGKAPWS